MIKEENIWKKNFLVFCGVGLHLTLSGVKTDELNTTSIYF